MLANRVENAREPVEVLVDTATRATSNSDRGSTSDEHCNISSNEDHAEDFLDRF